MRTKIYVKIAVTLLLVSIFTMEFTTAQVAFRKPLNNASDITIKGNMQMIGNAVTGLSGFHHGVNYNPNDDFDLGWSNDRRNVGYIDIDSDPTTFSSSSADLHITNTACAKIAYVGLYWAATYFTQKLANGKPVTVGLPLPDPRPDFRTIKLRTPGAAAYVDVTAEAGDEGVIYDGYRNTSTNPGNVGANDLTYVCYADLTEDFKKLKEAGASINGTYTVANVRSATGNSDSPGISNGWTLVIIYEDPALPERYFSTRHGFLAISNADRNFVYDGFQTLPPPNDVRARFGVATLEGDYGIPGDRLSILREPLGGSALSLFSNPANGEDNFFNCSITVDGNYNTARNPASENTLGFDADIFDIPNPKTAPGGEPSSIGWNQTEVEFTAGTTGDWYRIFLNMFSVDIIEPELKVFKRVLDEDLNDITGGGVTLGQSLYYELTIQNQGNEDIINAFINDELPANIDLNEMLITVPTGVTYTIDDVNRSIRFDIADNIVERFDPSFTIRFGVNVVNTCQDLRDACSKDIQNIAKATYTGEISGTTNSGEDSVLGQDSCQADIAGASNFLINPGDCNGDFEDFFCQGTHTLTAGGGFPTYVWTNLDSGAVVGNAQSLTITSGGRYRVDKTGNPDCNDMFETWTVDSFTDVVNPIIAIANDPAVNGNIRTCAADGREMPELFLCGANDEIVLDSGFAAATSILWQRLDPLSCPTVDRDPNCPTLDSECSGFWTNVGNANDQVYTVTEAGEYRIRATFDNTCDIDFYFNVFKNSFEPNLVIVKDIICGNPGTLNVQNSSDQYEYQLITPETNTTIGYQDSATFSGLTEEGTYQLNVRQKTGANACIFTASRLMEELESDVEITVNSPDCPTDQGNVVITVTNSQANYLYTITNTAGTYTVTTGNVTNTSHTFNNLNPDDYQVEVESYDGDCIETRSITVLDAPDFTATAAVTSDLRCNPGYQPDPTLNDENHPNFDPTAPPFDDREFIAEITITTNGGSGNFTYSRVGTTETTGDNPIEVTVAGNYTYIVSDIDTGCTATTNEVTVNPYVPVTGTIAGTNPVCAGETGSITVTVTAGEAPYTYELKNITDLAVALQTETTSNTTHTFVNVATGTYLVTMSDRFGCPVDSNQVTISEPTAITATVAHTQISCDVPQGTITVTSPTNGTPPYFYSIDGTDYTNTTGSFTGLASGDYNVYIRDGNTTACPVLLSTVTIDPLQEVTDIDFDIDNINCTTGTNQEGTITVSATGTNGVTAADFEYRITLPLANATAFAATTIYTLPVGTYTFEARTTSDNCIRSEQITINPVDNIAVTANKLRDVTCVDDTDGEFTFTTTDFATTYSYTVTGPPTFTPISVNNTSAASPATAITGGAGTYTITVTDDSTSCSQTATVEINEPADPLTFTFNVDDTDCGASNGIITVTATGGRGGYQYELRDATNTTVIENFSTSNIFSPLAAATYTINVRDGNDTTACLAVPQQATVDTSSPPTIARTDADWCYTSADPASLEITITNGVAPYTYTVNGGGDQNAVTNPFTISNLSPGIQNIIVKDVNGCTSNTITETIQPQIAISAALDKNLDCTPGNNNASISVTPTGGNGGDVITVEIDGTGGFVAIPGTWGTSPFSIDTAGTYQFQVTDSESCTAVSNIITVTDNPLPVATATANHVTCNGLSNGSVEITVDTSVGTPPYQINFNGLGNSNNTSYGGLAAGPYNYVVTDGKGCSETFSITVNEPAAIGATISSTPLECDPTPPPTLGTITASAVTGGTISTTGYIYTIHDSSGALVTDPSLTPGNTITTTATSVTFGGLDFGSYYIQIVDENGCEFRSPLEEISSPPDDLDFVAVAVASDCNTNGAVYDVFITNGARDYEIRIVNHPDPILSTFSLTNGNVDPSSPVPPAPFVLDATPGGNVHQFTGLTFSIPYIIEVRDNGGCVYQERLVPTNGPSAISSVEVATRDITCNGLTDGEFEYTVNNYTGTDIEWEVYRNPGILVPILSGSNSSAGAPFTNTITGIPQGNYYVITFTPTEEFCGTRLDFTIEEPPLLQFSLGTPTVGNCNQDSQIVVTAQGGRPPYQYAAVLDGVTPVAADFGADNVLVLDPNAGADLDWDIYVTDASNCTIAHQDVTITYTADPAFNLPLPTHVDDACNFDGSYEFTVTATGTGQLEYGIDDGDPATTDTPSFVTDTPNDGSFTFTVTGPGTYNYFVRDPNGCSDTGQIIVHPELLIDAVPGVIPTCTAADGTIIATVSGGSAMANWTFTLIDLATGSAAVGVTQAPGPNVATQVTFSNVQPGNYRAEVVDAVIGPAPGGCTETDTITIDDPVQPTLSPATTANVSCNGGNDGSILVNLDAATATEGPYTYQLFETATNTQVGVDQIDNPLFAITGTPSTPITAREYRVVVTSSKGCQVVEQPITILEPSQVTASSARTNYACGGDNIPNYPTITITIANGTPPYYVSYTGPGGLNVSDIEATDTGGTSHSFEATVSGTYDITVKDSNGCSILTPLQEIIPTFPIITNEMVVRDATAVNAGEISCDNPETVIVSVADDGLGTGDFQFEVVETGATINTPALDFDAQFTLPDSGEYTFIITDDRTGCTETVKYTVDLFDTITVTATQVDPVSCFGDLTGSININVSDYTGAYNYTIVNTVSGAPVTNGVGNTSTNPLLVGSLPSGVFRVDIEALDHPFCDESFSTVTITSPDSAVGVTLESSRVTCNPGSDGKIQAVASGGAGSFQYQLEKPAGNILVPYGTNTTGIFEDLDPDAANDYTVRVRDANGCEASETINIPAPVATGVTTSSTDVTCFEGTDGTITAVANGGQGPGTYLFRLEFPGGVISDAVTSTTDTHVFTDLPAGNYTVLVSDDLTCESSEARAVIGPAEVEVEIAVTEITCADMAPDVTVTGIGGTGSYTFSMDGINFVGSGTTHTFADLAPGTYQFYVRDTNGCEAAPPSNEVVVILPDPLQLNLDENNTAIVCFSERTGSIDSQVSGSLGDYQYEITGTDYLGATVNIGPQSESFFGELLAGTYTYTVMTDPGCPTVTLPFNITQPEEFVVTAVPQDISCNGETDGRIEITATGGNQTDSSGSGEVIGYVYTLYASNGEPVYRLVSDEIDQTIGIHVFEDLPADTYTAEVTDARGCPFSISDLIIEEPAAITADIIATTPEQCAGDMNGTANVSITGGVPGYFWSITGEDASFVPVPDPTNLELTNLPGGITTLFLRDSNNSSGCQIALNIDIIPGVELSAVLEDKLDCPVRDEETAQVIQDEVYRVEFNVADDFFDVFGNRAVLFSLRGVNGTADPMPNNNYTGEFVVAPGEYEGTMLHEVSGCQQVIGVIQVEEYTPLSIPVAQMTNNPQDPNEYEIIVTGGVEEYTYYVTFEDEEQELTDNIFTVRKTGDYKLRVEDSKGCSVEIYQFITYINIRIPNYFTPDDPNITEEERFWYPRQITPNSDDPFYFDNMEVKVFDRYGRLLKQFLGDQKGWDGLYQGKELPSGDYWFTIILNDIDNREFTGHFTLYR
ncbi:T9SS type B sorting domain-containing protein [Aquimarina hainanensis]|uniref:T9SS type B sorting domain-containing protein n=1 Tax=Aquimarina hainanensis TaxID=1578017 RepID=A0ABW5N6V8_9FLAO